VIIEENLRMAHKEYADRYSDRKTIIKDRLQEWISGRPVEPQHGKSTSNSGMDDDPFFGRMTDPTAAAAVRGPCGDEMEFYLVVREDVIENVKYHTRGCSNTRSCGKAVADRVRGKTISEALLISAGELIQAGDCKPEEGRHCAILAVSTLYRAIADYLLKP